MMAARELSSDELDRLSAKYDAHLADQMGHLHNRFVAFIAESRLPLTHVLMALRLLERELLDISAKQYLGG
jgi:hypothetical protein